MKALKILFLSVFLIFLVNTASAVVVYGEWDSNQAQSISIEDGDSVDFSAFFGTISPPMTISVKLYDSGNDLIHTFEDTVVSQNFGKTYTVNKNIYSRPGDYEVRISGSDSYGDMSTVLYLDVTNYPPVITSTPITEVNENKPYIYDVEATDQDNHPLTYSLEDSHGWLLIDLQTGLITGTAPDVGGDTYFNVGVVVSDGIDIDTQSYMLTVIWIPNPFLSQTIGPSGDLNVEYHATLSELDSAILEIYYKALGSPDYDPDPIATRNIDTPSYTETFNFYEIPGHEKTKGDYRFVLEAVGYDLSETDGINILDYAPEVDLSSVSADFNEEDSIEITLPVPTDKNPEDEPVAYLSASSSKTTADINGYILTLEGNRDETGAYSVELEFGDPNGAKATTILSGYIDNLIDISGVLENNEDDTEIQGVIRVYYQNNSDYIPLEIDKIYEEEMVHISLGKIETTPNGTFSFQINERPSELDEIVLQARIGTDENYEGYVRTIELSGDDHAGVLVRAVPYAPYENDPGIFRQFMSELCSDQPNTRFDFDGEYLGKYSENYTGLIGIEILSENPFGAENGTFTEEQQNNIKNKILDLNDISGIIGNYNISEEQIFIVNGSDGHFDFYEYHIDPKGKVVAYQGWIIVVPYYMPQQGIAEPRKAGTLVYGGTVYLRPDVIGGRVTSHEFGHIFIGSGHPEIFGVGQNQTVMGPWGFLITTGPADKKAGKLIYEETFMTFPLAIYPRVDNLYNILGPGFYGESQGSGTLSEYYSSEPEEDEEEDFTEGQQNSDDDNIISSDNIGASNDVNADTPYEETIYLQSNANKNNIITSLSNIIRQVISFISQKLRSIF